MSSATFYALAGAGLFGLGLYGLIVRVHLLRKLLAFNVMSSGAFLVLVALGDRVAGGTADPVPQALVLTGIVVALSATALAAALIRRLYNEKGATRLDSRADAPAEAPADVPTDVP